MNIHSCRAALLIDFQRIPMETLHVNGCVPFSLYILESAGMEQIAVAGDLFSQENCSILQARRIKDLFVRRNEMGEYLNYLDQHMEQVAITDHQSAVPSKQH